MTKSITEMIESFFQNYNTRFFNDNGTLYAQINFEGNHVTSIDSEKFELLLNRIYASENSEYLSAKLLDNMKTFAKIKASERKETLAIRIAFRPDTTWLNLNDKQSVRIDRNGWGTQSSDNCLFYRDDSSRDLPAPSTTGDIWDLKKVVKLNNDAEYLMVIAWFITLFYDTSYPFLILIGQEGSAKSTSTKNLKDILDPVEGGLRSFQKNADDIYISAQSNMILGYDNISYINLQLSDELCRIATGGSISKRKQYSNSDQIILKAKRAILMNGIDGVPDFPDFISRSVIINLQALEENEIRTEEQMRELFNSVHSSILGAILNLVVKSLSQNIISAKPKHRLATYYNIGCWVSEELGFDSNVFIDAFSESQGSYRKKAIEDSFLLDFIVEKVQKMNGEYSVTATNLLTEVHAHFQYQFVALKTLPKDASAVGKCINRYSRALREFGIKVIYSRTPKGRITHFIKEPTNLSLPSAPKNLIAKTPLKSHFNADDIPF
jgi:hypothetical protein